MFITTHRAATRHALIAPSNRLSCPPLNALLYCRLRLICDGARAETRFRLSAKWTSPFNSAGAAVQSTIGSRGVHISGSNAGYTMFRGSVKSTGYPLRQFPLHLPSRASPCAITFQLDSYQVHCSCFVLKLLKYPANGLPYFEHDNSVSCCLLDTC